LLADGGDDPFDVAGGLREGPADRGGVEVEGDEGLAHFGLGAGLGPDGVVAGKVFLFAELVDPAARDLVFTSDLRNGKTTDGERVFNGEGHGEH
jgi:hypothetical protein